MQTIFLQYFFEQQHSILLPCPNSWKTGRGSKVACAVKVTELSFVELKWNELHTHDRYKFGFHFLAFWSFLCLPLSVLADQLLLTFLNHRILRLGRDLLRPSSPTPLRWTETSPAGSGCSDCGFTGCFNYYGSYCPGILSTTILNKCWYNVLFLSPLTFLFKLLLTACGCMLCMQLVPPAVHY